MGIFRKFMRNVMGADTHYPLVFISLTSSFSVFKQNGLIKEYQEEELLDSLYSFWDNLRAQNVITSHEYSSYFLMTMRPPTENYIFNYAFTEEETPLAESLTLDLLEEFRKYRSVDLRRESADFGNNIPKDLVKIIEARGFECPDNSMNMIMAYAVGNTYKYLLFKSDSDGRMDRLSKRALASEMLPVFLATWYFRKKN